MAHLTDNLRALYYYDNNTVDSSGNGNSLTLFGPTYNTTTPKLKSACLELATDDYADTPDIMDVGTGDMTAGTWFKTSQDLSSVRFLMDKVSSASNGFSLDLGLDVATKIRFWIAGVQARVATLYNDDAWHLAVGRRKGGVLRLYADNIFVDEATGATGTVNNAQPVRMGESTLGGGNYDGLLDGTFLYDRALTDGGVTVGNAAGGEIAQWWNSGNGLILSTGRDNNFPAGMSLFGRMGAR